MTEPTSIGELYGVAVYPYGLCVAIFLLAACALLCLLAKARWHKPLDGLRLMLYILPMGLLFARLGYLLVRWRFIIVDYTPNFWGKLWLGGYSLAGASIGIALACLLFTHISGHTNGDVMDIVMPAALLALAGVRTAEQFTMDGIGIYVETEALWRFPFAVVNTYEEYVMPVFFWEALTALLICAGMLLWMRPAGRKRGDAALIGMLWLGLSQVLWESLRTDDFLRFGFVRINQLWGVLLTSIAFGIWLKRCHPSRRQVIASMVAYVGYVCILVCVEFGLDKSTVPNTILYGLMVLVLLLVGLWAVRLQNASQKGEKTVAEG